MKNLTLALVILIVSLAGTAFAGVVDDVVTLQQQGVSKDVMSAWIERQPHGYRVTPEDISRMKNANVPDDVVIALLRNGDYTIRHSAAVSQQQQPQTVVTESADQTYIAPSPTYVSSTPVYTSTVYDYGYPYYSSYYGYPYSSGLYLNFGFGNGQYYRGHRYTGYRYGYSGNYGNYGHNYNHGSNTYRYGSGVSSGYRYGSAVNGTRFTSNTGSAQYYSGRAGTTSSYRGSSGFSGSRGGGYRGGGHR